jgi:hypothetical protein
MLYGLQTWRAEEATVDMWTPARVSLQTWRAEDATVDMWTPVRVHQLTVFPERSWRTCCRGGERTNAFVLRRAAATELLLLTIPTAHLVLITFIVVPVMPR